MNPRASRSSTAPPRVLDLFCGIGGLSLGLERAGFAPIGGVDFWEDAARTFENNHSDLRCLVSDLRHTQLEEISEYFDVDRTEIDVLAGGPPCQGFSTIGKRDRSDPRNEMWRHFLELVTEIQPAYVLIENVEGLTVMDRGGVRDEIVAGFARIGYRMKCRLLRSADYGVPQLRKRVFFLGWLDGLAEPMFPDPLSGAPVTVGEAIFDLPSLRAGEKSQQYDKPASTAFQKARRGRTRKLRNHEAANHCARLVEVIKHIPDGGNRKSIPDELQPKSGFHNSYARLASYKPAVAVTSTMRKPSSARAIHPIQDRGLTVREGLRLQSFDDGFEVLGSRSSQYIQVGNCVPPLLAEAVGACLLKAYSENSARKIARARNSRQKPVTVCD